MKTGDAGTRNSGIQLVHFLFYGLFTNIKIAQTAFKHANYLGIRGGLGIHSILPEMMLKYWENNQLIGPKRCQTLNEELKIESIFRIRHYAGTVIYNVEGFVDKNRDTQQGQKHKTLFCRHFSLESLELDHGAVWIGDEGCNGPSDKLLCL